MPSASSRSSSASITNAGEICSAPGRQRTRQHAGLPACGDRSGGKRGIVGDGGRRKLHRTQDARRADLADQRVCGERRQRVGELRLELTGPFAQPLTLHDVQVGERGGGRRRVSRIGVAVSPDARALRPERLGDPRSRDRGAHRQVAAGDALRARDDVGLELPASAREPRTAAAEPRDDFVRDEQHAGLAAHGAGGRQVAVGSGVHAARADHRLAEERGDPAGADLLDHGAQIVGVVPSDLHDVLDQLPVAGRVGRDARQARPRGVHAVVRALAADQDRPFGLPHELPEPPRHLRRGVDRVGAAARQEHAAVGDGREGRNALGQLRRRAVRQVAERRVGGERGHLGCGRVGDVLAAETDVREPEARGRIEVSPSRLVPDPNAVAADKDQLAVRGHRRHVGERMPEVGHAAEATSGTHAGRVDGTSGPGRSLSPCRTPGWDGANAPLPRCSRRGGARSPRVGPSRCDRC